MDSIETPTGYSKSMDSPNEFVAPNDVPQLVDHLFRHQAGQVVATLTRVLGAHNLQLAEDVVQETLIKALGQWSYHGVPINPQAWLVRVAKNHAVDILRREQRFSSAQAADLELVDSASDVSIDLLENELYDDQLRMMFTCCHPALSREVQVTLTLKTLGGFGVSEIAGAFLTNEATIAQRLVRARRTLRESRLPFAVPEKHELSNRLAAVLDVLYLLFNEGYSAHRGEDLVRDGLCAEAIRLTTLVAAHPIGDLPEVHALLALMLLQAARLPARRDALGDIVLLEEQDRTCWDQTLIVRGLLSLQRSATGSELSAYHLQAGIAACHVSASSFATTNWQRILNQYDSLIALNASPVIALNRAVAIAMLHGPDAGLAELERLANEPSLRNYALFHATCAALWQQSGDLERAATWYRTAHELSENEPERRFLQRKLDAIIHVDSPNSDSSFH